MTFPDSEVPPHPHPLSWRRRRPTLRARGSFPAVLADAGEDVAFSHARPSVLAGSRVARAVLGYKTQKSLFSFLPPTLFRIRAETENERPTRVAGAAPPARRAAAQEGVAVVEAGAAIAAGGGVALALA